MFQVLLTALLLLGIAYWIYDKLNPTKSKQYQDLDAEKTKLEQELEALKNETIELKQSLKNKKSDEN